MEIYNARGDGVDILLTGDEVATAIMTYLTAHNVHISGARTVMINGEMINRGRVYVDPSAFVIHNGVRYGKKIRPGDTKLIL